MRGVATGVQRLQAVVTRRKDIHIVGMGHGDHWRSSLQVRFNDGHAVFRFERNYVNLEQRFSFSNLKVANKKFEFQTVYYLGLKR